MKSSNTVQIVEVGLRDGLQNESVHLTVEARHELFLKLVDAGLTHLEVGSFVSPKWVPAMAVSEELFSLVLADQKNKRIPENLTLSALVPNLKGLDPAFRLGVREVALFAACSESFSMQNTNCSMKESFTRLETVAKAAISAGLRLRGYLSVCFGCPFEGAVALDTVVENVQRMRDLGVYQVSLGDTIGLAAAGDVERLLNRLLDRFHSSFFAGHFHDTRGQAIANILRAHEMGLRVFDSSIGGLGGCPYAPSATGNVATEDVVYLFDSLQIETGINLRLLLDTHNWLAHLMGRDLPSKVGRAQQNSSLPLGNCFL